MDTLDWIIIISIVVFLCLGIWGVRFPRSGKDWKKSREETMSLLFRLSLFLAFFLLLWYIMGVVEWPDAMDMIIWISVITFILLILAAIFLPTGAGLNLGKKDRNTKTADDDED